MAYLEQILIRGIRSIGPSEDDTHLIQFLNPLTIISGPNGTGKTTLIEALNYITSSDLPAGKLATFMHSLQVARKPRVDAMIKLQFVDSKKRRCVATKRMNSTLSKGGKLQCKSDELNIQIITKDGRIQSLSSKVADFQKEIINLLGVPAAILTNVIFCHQEDSTWPLSEPKELKTRFDRIFQLTKFVKALDNMKKLKRDYEGELKTLVERQINKEMIVTAKAKYIEDRDNCSAIRTDSIEKIQNLNTRIKEYNVIIRDTNEKLLKLDDYERKGELKRTELRLLTERLNGMRVTTYPGSEEDIRQELQRMEESSEYRYLETEKEQLLGKIQDTDKELLIMRKDRKSAEEQMVKFMSINMVRRDLLGEIDVLEMEIRSSFNLPQHGSFVEKINYLIAKHQEDLETLKTESLHQLESAQRSVDEAQAEYAKLMCELKTCSEMIDLGEMNIKEAEIKLNMRESSKEELSGLNRHIASLEDDLFLLPSIDENRIQDVSKQRQLAINKIDSLRLQYREAEKFEDLEKEIEKKRIETKEAHDRLADLIRKHKDGYVGVFGSMPAGPWSDKILSVANSTQIKLKEVEDNFKQAELEFDRTSQSLNQLEIEDEKTHNEIRELKQKIWDICGCSPLDVSSTLSDIRRQLSFARKKLAPLNTKAELYESWGEETNKTSCCPLCERKFGNQAGANELANKLMNLSRSLPDEIEFLSERVAKHEEQERKYSDALVYVEQLRKIEEEKITEIQNRISTLKRMATSNSVVLKSKQEEFDKISLISKTIGKIQSDVSLMDSLFCDVNRLDSELEEIEYTNQKNDKRQSALEIKRHLTIEEELIQSLEAEGERLQTTYNQKNRLITEVQSLRERRIKLGEISAQTTHLEEQISKINSELIKQRCRYEEINRNLPIAKEQIFKAREERNFMERRFKEQEETMMTILRDLRNKQMSYRTVTEKLSSLSNSQSQVEHCSSRLTELDQNIVDLERNKTFLDMRINDVEGSRVKKRTLEDQLTKKMLEKKMISLEKELEDITWTGEDRDTLTLYLKKTSKDRDKAEMEKARLDGQLEEVDKKYNVAVSSLASKEMKQAEQIYRDVIVDKMVVQETITDLDKYTKCLDSSIIQFHSNKMTAINEILDDLWRKVYKGGDIESIKIKSEGVSAGEKRKAYDYRVVMLVEGGIEIDMRERCSAGQKMLASILIRIALADVFGGMCSIIALDEPTTNLDSCKVEHMAEMLNDLIAARRNDDSQGISIGKQFQMIVITHDERLVDKLMLGSRPEYIYVLGKDARGLSYVKRQYPDGHTENIR